MGAFDGTYIEGAEGNYLVFEDLHDASFHLDATPTTVALFRAPLNGIQIVEAGAVPPEFQTMDLRDKRLSVVEDSTLNVMTPGGADFGPLVMEDGVLTVTGAGPASFTGTTIGDTADAVGFDSQTPLNLGGIDGNDRDVQISKVGDGDLVLDDPGARLDGATFDAQEGRLIGLGSSVFGGATLEISTGELVLAAAAGDSSPVAFPNPVVASDKGMLTAGKGDQPNAADAPMTVQVPSVSVDGNLKLRSTDDYTLEVAGEVSGSGKLILQEGNLLFSGGGSVPNVSVYRNANVATGPDGISATDTLRVRGAGYVVNSGAIVLNESDPAAGTATLTLADSEVTIPPKLAPAGAVLHYSFNVENDAAGFSGALDLEEGAVFSVSFGEGPGGEGIADKLVTDGDVKLGGTAKLELEISGADNGARMFKKGVYELIRTSAGSEGGVVDEFLEVTNLEGYVSAGPDGNGLDEPDFTILTLTIDCDLLAGDANLDTVTDVRDFNKWNANKFTSGTEWISGDFNGDGVTDVRNFNIWNANKFTSATCTTPGGLVEGQVPEPGTLALLACGLAGLLLVWRRRR